jgi:phage baseplate assembly protein W
MSYINIKFPLEDDVKKNKLFTLNQTTKEAIRSDLLLLLLTEKGERYYYPDYGTDLLKFIFEPNDEIIEKDILIDIKETVQKFIPNLKIESVQFTKNENGNGLSVLIPFIYSENLFSEPGVIELTF